MRHWLFHPILFYPLAALAAAGIIAFSLEPQSWPREPRPVAAAVDHGSLVFEDAAFDAPVAGPEQAMTIVRSFWGSAQALRIAQQPNQAPPVPTDRGVQILLTRAQAALIEGRPATIEVTYGPLPVNAANGLAVTILGDGPAHWVSQEAPPQSGSLVFEIPPQTAVNAIGLRALSDSTQEAEGLEIRRVRVTPRA
ncbi:MAG: hypothetical protein K2P58_01935 [Hyphomonadaceae bacterium]|nr:hypothetical protein [Hyphomonadaceae bacterium]